MNQDIIDRQVELMCEQQLDAMVAFSHQNFAWTTGFIVPTHPLMRWRLTAVVVTANGQTGLYTLSMEEKSIWAHEPEGQLWIWEEFKDNAIPVFADMITSLGLSSGRIGIETDVIQAKYWEEIKRQLPNVHWLPAQEHYERMRFIKTPREIDLIRKLSSITDQSLLEALTSVRSGQTEMDLAGALGGAIYKNGAENFPIMVCDSGDRTAIPNAGPTDKKLNPGDPIRLEAFGVIGGYHAGVARSAIVEDCSDEIRKIYDVLVEGRSFLLEAIKPGASSREVFFEHAEILEDNGLPVFNFLGHGIGLYLHEQPYFERYHDYELQENMVLGIEPVALLEDFGLQIKDIVAVTQNGAELLSDVTEVANPVLISA